MSNENWKKGKAEAAMLEYEKKRMDEAKKRLAEKRQREELNKLVEKTKEEEEWPEDHKLSTITHGIIVVDPESVDEDDNLEILHFVGYWEEPDDAAADELRKELMEDEELGLTDIIGRCDLLMAPDDIVEHWRNIGLEDGV